MMPPIDLQKDGTLTRNSTALTSDPLMSLGSRVTLGAACTLRSFFSMLEIYPPFIRLSPFIPDAVAQYRSCPETGCVLPGMDAVELSKTIEMIGFPGDPRIDAYVTFQGVGGGDTHDIKTSGLENLLDMPLLLGKLKHIIFGDQLESFEFGTVFSLFEFIEGISWELSFHYNAAQCRIKNAGPQDRVHKPE